MQYLDHGRLIPREDGAEIDELARHAKLALGARHGSPQHLNLRSIADHSDIRACESYSQSGRFHAAIATHLVS